MTLIKKLHSRIDTALFNHGVATYAVRSSLSIQFIILITTFCMSLILSYFTYWPMFFTAGFALSCYQFYSIAKVAQVCLSNPTSIAARKAYFFKYVARFIAMCLIVALFIVWAHTSTIPFVLGFIVSLFSITMLFLLTYFSRYTKGA